MLRDTYVLIDTEALKHNLRALGEAAGVPLMAVVKADGYGHGMAQVSRAAWEIGLKWFAVSNPDEATELRRVLPDANILVLSSVMPKACETMVREGIAVAVYKPEHVFELQKAASAAGKRAKAHLKADTGMGRIGFVTDEELGILLAALSECPDVEAEGLFTHFASADEAELSFAKKQLDRFNCVRARVFAAGLSPICHAANSAGMLTVPEARFDMARAGISMYGYPPSAETDMKGVSLLPVMSFMSYVSNIKHIKAGDTVSYGRIYTATGDTVIATVPAGYADGYQRALSGRAEAFAAGRRIKQVGRVCMDQIMFDATGADIKEGDPVELFGRHIGADELASVAGTISYELLTGISKRVPRVYAP